MRSTKVSQYCIFPSDGTNRIRFTGQSAYRSISAGNVRPPEDFVFCDSVIIIGARKGSVKRNVLFKLQFIG